MSTPTKGSLKEHPAPVAVAPTRKKYKPRISVKICAKGRGPHPDYTNLMTENMNSDTVDPDGSGVTGGAVEDPLDDSNRMLRPFELGLFPDADESDSNIIPPFPSQGGKLNQTGIFEDDGEDQIVIVQAHPSTPFVCGICKNMYATQFKLDIHLRVHVNQKPFQCDRCNKGYRNKNCYDRHLKQFHAEGAEENPYNCDICGKNFRLKYSLRAHKYKHSVGEKYKCEECGVCCYTATTLTAHKNKQHTGEKPFPCEHCHKSYFTKSELNRHSMTHTGVKPYTCEICSRGFAHKQNLTAHVRKMHAGPMELQNMSNPLPFILPFLEAQRNMNPEGGEKIENEFNINQGTNDDNINQETNTENDEESDVGGNEEIDIKPNVNPPGCENEEMKIEIPNYSNDGNVDTVNEIDIKPNITVKIEEINQYGENDSSCENELS